MSIKYENADLFKIFLAVLLVGPGLVGCFVEVEEMPKEFHECVESLTNKVMLKSGNITSSDEENFHTHCLQQFLWKSGGMTWDGFNITQGEMKFINSLTDSLTRRRRVKRQIRRPSIFPPTRFRIRREYRRMSDYERRAFHRALNVMKRSGQYDTFANLHRGIVVTSAHGGPNFFGWHRVYLAIVEEALRRINRRLSLPYWDSSLDFDMENPVNSIIWSAPFLGNGDGFVTSGPFANWATSVGLLARNVGAGSRLISKDVIRRIMTRCRTREISAPTAQAQFNLEFAHGGPHIYVGGQMAGLNTAAHDPTFFMHHAFIDYLWEMFRIRQRLRCRVNPSRDYPPATGQHAQGRLMDGLPGYRNIDGYRSYWTRLWYRYERSPTCSRWRPFCRTPYLRCDVRRGRCISVARVIPEGVVLPGMRPGQRMAGPAFAFGSQRMTAIAVRAQAEVNTINVGPKFSAPPSESRTQARTMMVRPLRRFRRALVEPSVIVDTRNNETTLINPAVIQTVDDVVASAVDTPLKRSVVTPFANSTAFGKTFEAPASDGRTSDVLGRNIARGVYSNDPVLQMSNFPSGVPFPFSPPMPLLPNRDSPQLPTPISPTQNTFSLNGRNAASEWVYLPIEVVYTKPPTNRFLAAFLTNRQTFFNQNTFSPFSEMYDRFVQRNRACSSERSGASQIVIQSQGLNYMGTFTDHALIDSRLPISSAMTYIGVKSPMRGTTHVLLTAHDGCGVMCQPTCMQPYSSPPVYQPCTGVLNISSQESKTYGKNIADAVSKVWQGTGHTLQRTTENIRIVFQCSREYGLSWNLDGTNNTTQS